ncbi:MAG: hypothetical protein Q9P14_15900 [candidate division KSB1 bacterium]|nr:hypothetical protein [candidate division KSB1 bacterium]
MKPIRERKHRLSRKAYVGQLAVSYTKCVQNRKALFTDGIIFRTFERILLQELALGDCDALVYLFMPDHAHLLLLGKSSRANSLHVVYRFSQKTGFWLSRNRPQFRWQKDFYDHILRREEDIERHVKYILHNPVRRGLVENWKMYPYKGSTVYDLNQWE